MSIAINKDALSIPRKNFLSGRGSYQGLIAVNASSRNITSWGDRQSVYFSALNQQRCCRSAVQLVCQACTVCIQLCHGRLDPTLTVRHANDGIAFWVTISGHTSTLLSFPHVFTRHFFFVADPPRTTPSPPASKERCRRATRGRHVFIQAC